MTAYYDQSKNMICIRELYSDVCEINDDLNVFFTSIRNLLTDLSDKNLDLELKIIKYMCDTNIIYPNEFTEANKNQNENLIKKLTELGCDRNKTEQFIANVLKITNNYTPQESIINFNLDPRIKRRESK